MLVKIKRLTSPDVEYNGEIYSKEENDRMIKLADYLLKHNKLYLINKNYNINKVGIIEYTTVKPDSIIGIVKEIHDKYIIVDINDDSEYIDIIDNYNVFALIRGRMTARTRPELSENNKYEMKTIITNIKLTCFDLMIKKEKFKTITLCGSTKFKNEFYQAFQKLTSEGYIVLMPGIFSKHDNIKLTEDEIKMFHYMHMQRIDMSDAIYIINKDGYIGASTLEEIEYAKSNNKEILYLENQ